MALRVISRVFDAASAPAYQAPTTVCSKPKDSVATTSPSTVSEVRSLWRSAFLEISLRACKRIFRDPHTLGCRAH